jgi:hypothetical protein
MGKAKVSTSFNFGANRKKRGKKKANSTNRGKRRGFSGS